MKRQFTIAVLILIILGACAKKKQEPVSPTTNKVATTNTYNFKGLVEVAYDNTKHVHWVSYSYPADYSWGSQQFVINSNNTFSGFGGGSYSLKGDTTVLSAINWPAATAYNYNVVMGYTVNASSVKGIFCDTTLNLSAFGSNLFAAYAIGPSNTLNDLAPYHLRLFLFQ